MGRMHWQRWKNWLALKCLASSHSVCVFRAEWGVEVFDSLHCKGVTHQIFGKHQKG